LILSQERFDGLVEGAWGRSHLDTMFLENLKEGLVSKPFVFGVLLFVWRGGEMMIF